MTSSKGAVSARILDSTQEINITSILTDRGIRLWTHEDFPKNIYFGTGANTISENITTLNNLALAFEQVSGVDWEVVADNIVDHSTASVSCSSKLYFQSPAVDEEIVVTELGVGTDRSNLWAYGLVVDSLGKPASVTLRKGEYIRVEIRISIATSAEDNTVIVRNARAHIARIPRKCDITLKRENSPELEIGLFPKYEQNLGDLRAEAEKINEDSTTAIVKLGMNSGNSAKNIYNKVIVEGAGASASGLALGIKSEDSFSKDVGTEVSIKITHKIENNY